MGIEGLSPAEIDELMLEAAFHRWLGVTLVKASEGRVELLVPWRQEWGNRSTNGAVHGGILMSLLDVAAEWALARSAGQLLPTINFSTQFVRAAPPGDLTVVGEVVRTGRRVATGSATVFDVGGRLSAIGTGGYLRGDAVTRGEFT